jgi:hypothetical protein
MTLCMADGRGASLSTETRAYGAIDRSLTVRHGVPPDSSNADDAPEGPELARILCLLMLVLSPLPQNAIALVLGAREAGHDLRAHRLELFSQAVKASHDHHRHAEDDEDSPVLVAHCAGTRPCLYDSLFNSHSKSYISAARWRLGDDGVTDDLIERLQRSRVDPAVIAYARDAIDSGQTTEATVRRLRALGLCPKEFFDAYDWQDVARRPQVTPQPPAPPSQGMSLGTKSLLQRVGLFLAYVLILIGCKIFGPSALIFAAPLAIAVLLMIAGGLWITLKGVVTAWWRGGFWADVAMAAGIIAVIGFLWPSLGIWDNAAGRRLFGPIFNQSDPELAPQFDAKYGAGPATRAMALDAPPVILNEADYDALPSGTLYIGRDGLSRRKR